MFFFLLRAILFGVSIAILHEYPMIQIISILAINVAMIFYILFARPFTKKSDFVEVCLYEFILLVANGSALKLLLMDRENNYD